MRTLDWQEAPEPSTQKAAYVASTSNVWFGVSMGFLGVIVGYMLPHLIR